MPIHAQPLDLLEDLAAARHLGPEEPASDPFAIALSGAGWARRASGPLGRIGATWAGVRGRFLDRTIRRWTVPENAQVIVIGPGLDPALLRMPGGLVRPRTVHLIDRADVLDTRRERLKEAGLRAPMLPHASADPRRWPGVITALGQLPLRPTSALALVFAGQLPFESLDALLGALDAMAALPHAHLQLAFTWLAPGAETLPEPAATELARLATAWPVHPLALDLACRAVHPCDLTHTPLLRLGATELGFGTTIVIP